MKMHHLKNTGDTIVEVLIAMAVVSLVLAGAYTSTRKSANATRTAQEQGEALKLAESQVEQIKVALDSVPPIAVSPGSYLDGSNLYTITTTIPILNNYVVIVTWPGLSGNTNSVELDYKARQ